jgi:hypothetical protein
MKEEKREQPKEKTNKVPITKEHLFYRIKDKDGNVVSEKEVPCHSWTKNFYLSMFSNLCGPNSNSSDGLQVKTIAGVSLDNNTIHLQWTNATADYLGGSGVANKGIVVGNSDTVQTFGTDDYALASIIAHGTGAGQLQYSAQATATVADDGANRTVTHVRSFVNGSGGNVTVKEVGWYIEGYSDVDPYTDKFMWFRDILGTPIIVSNTQELEITFEITLTYPETIS